VPATPCDPGAARCRRFYLLENRQVKFFPQRRETGAQDTGIAHHQQATVLRRAFGDNLDQYLWPDSSNIARGYRNQRIISVHHFYPVIF